MFLESQVPIRVDVEAGELVIAMRAAYVGPHGGPLPVAHLAVGTLEPSNRHSAFVFVMSHHVVVPRVTATTPRTMVH